MLWLIVIKKKKMLKEYKMRPFKLITIILTIMSLFILTSCEKNPVYIDQNQQNEEFVQSNIGPIKILQINTNNVPPLFKPDSLDTTFYAEKYINARRGGRISVGDRFYGKSKIRFPRNALSENTKIRFEWSPNGTLEGTLNNVKFGPHGINFLKPVKVWLSYKAADLTGVNEDSLKIFYFNESTAVWELIGGKVIKNQKRIIGYLQHFSRYAIAAE